MRRTVWWLIAAMLSSVGVARADSQLSVEVTYSNSSFDIRAVDPAGTAYALNLSRGSSEIWASTDNARTWSFRGSYSGASFKEMAVLSDGTLLADVETSSGFIVLRSTNHGASWSNVLTLGKYRWLTPHNVVETGGTVYLLEYQTFTTSNVPLNLWASTNGGATWSVRHVFTGHRHGHGIRANASGELWALFGDTYSGVHRSSDQGVTWTDVLLGDASCAVDGVFVGSELLYGQDSLFGPKPNLVRLSPQGVLTQVFELPGPSYSIFELPGGGYLLGTTREIDGDVYPPGDVSAHLFGSADGVTWTELGNYPRIDAKDYARADVYWMLPSGEAVLNLRHVQTLSNGGRGYQLLRTSTSGTTTPPSPPPSPPPPTNMSFADNFDACTSTTNLGANWDAPTGFYCKAERARGERAPGATARAKTAALGDTDVAGLVQPNESNASGLIARASGTDYYAARLIVGSRYEIVRVNGSTTTVLGSVPASIVDYTSYRLRFVVSGTAPVTLELFVNGASLLKVSDASAPLATGFAGLLQGTGYRTQFDDFVLSGSASGSTPPPPTDPPPSPTPPPPTSSFSDNFDACTSTTDLGSNWTLGGTWYCKVGRARGETRGGVALAKATLPDDIAVQSLVQLNTGGTGSGVLARGTTSHFYLLRILNAGRMELVRMDNGQATVLGSVAKTFSIDVSYTIKLVATGSSTVQLTAYLNGSPVISATDSSAGHLTSGSAGLFSDGTAGSSVRTQYDNFSAKAP